jgi:outer membrane protein TolC
VALSVASCTDLFLRDDYTFYRTPPEGLHEIDVVKLDELSRTKPVTVEEAAAEAADRVMTVEEPAESLELNVADVRAAALANNLDLKVELVDPSIAQEAIVEEEAEFEPSLFGSVELARMDREPVIVGGPGLNTRRTSYDAGVLIPLRTGGTVSVSLPFNKLDDDSLPKRQSRDDPEIINSLYDAGLKFSISQPLLRDAGIHTNTHFIRVAKYDRDMTDARTKLEAIRILADADRAYWLLYAAREVLRVTQEQYKLAMKQLDEAERRVAAGAAPRVEIMRAESGVARRLEAIIVADTAVRRRERDLKRVMNREDLKMQSPTAVVPVTMPNPVGLDFAVANRMEMLELELQLAVDESSIDFERNSTLPALTLDYSYTLNGLGESFNDAFDGIGNGSYADYSFGLSAEVPIGNKAAKARLRRAMLQRLQRLASRDQRELAIRQQVYDVLDQLRENWQRIIAAGQEVTIAAATWQAERRQFEVGLRTSTEVLEAAARLAGAESREIRALAAYEISLINIAVATGTLLGQDRVMWHPTDLD